MKEELKGFINSVSFPCVMAKAVAKTGNLQVFDLSSFEEKESVRSVLKEIYQFIDVFRQNQKTLSSFALIIKQPYLFPDFEKLFWNFLGGLDHEDKKHYAHDPRVSSDPANDRYSFSLKSEAFFLLALHPESPRRARRFKYSAIIFNPHVQFENLRKNKIYKKVRDTIRLKDKVLQGFVNPMLNDFGEKSEVFQYLGKMYTPQDSVPLIY